MKINSFLKEIDFSKAELTALIDLALHFKQLKQNRIPHDVLNGYNIALLFEKASTRTRAAFTVAAQDLGIKATYLGASEMQLGLKESVSDTAKVLGSMFDGIEYRGFSQDALEELAQDAGVPVWNGLTDQWHPTQMLADFMTLKEHFGTLEGLHLAYVGDGRNNVANSLLVTAAILGVHITIIAPASLQPSKEVIKLAHAHNSGATITITSDPVAVKGADALYTDVWVSMGENIDFQQRIELLLPYQVNQDLLQKTENPDIIVLHCLPAFHDTKTKIGQEIYEKFGLPALEITDEVFQQQSSLIFQEAENRLHTIKAVLYASLHDEATELPTI
ncbi:ornithine carbamoyltransferase [Streptococcus cameli]